MSHPYTNKISANKDFLQFKEPTDASDYINKKKSRATYCIANKCAPSIKVASQSDRLLFNASNQISMYPCANGFNPANLNINLITTLDLSGVSVIKDMSNNTIPSIINPSTTPYLNYLIDPSGSLFGNSVCGINSFTKYMKLNINNSQYYDI